MPQLDFETLVSALSGVANDSKVACEPTDEAEDSPPESFWLSNDAEYDWWDRNAVYERNESTKASSISINPNSASNSQRFSKNLKKSKATTIIGLPKSQKASFAEARGCRRNHHKPGNTRLFPKRSASIGGKSDSTVFEPSSPKVSCIGRVRSKRGHNRRLRTRQRSISSTATGVSAAGVVRQKSSRSTQRKKKTGFIESVCSIFRSHRREKTVQKSNPPVEDSSTKKKRNNGRKTREGSTVSRTVEDTVHSEPAGLGSMNRFASGRRSESWGVGEIENHVWIRWQPRVGSNFSVCSLGSKFWIGC